MSDGEAPSFTVMIASLPRQDLSKPPAARGGAGRRGTLPKKNPKWTWNWLIWTKTTNGAMAELLVEVDPRRCWGSRWSRRYPSGIRAPLQPLHILMLLDSPFGTPLGFCALKERRSHRARAESAENLCGRGQTVSALRSRTDSRWGRQQIA